MKVENKTVVEVKWSDAWVDTGDILVSDAKKLKPILRSSIGWLVADNENELILSTDYYHSKEDSQYVNTIMVIPKGIIVEYWEYIYYKGVQ